MSPRHPSADRLASLGHTCLETVAIFSDYDEDYDVDADDGLPLSYSEGVLPVPGRYYFFCGRVGKVLGIGKTCVRVEFESSGELQELKVPIASFLFYCKECEIIEVNRNYL